MGLREYIGLAIQSILKWLFRVLSNATGWPALTILIPLVSLTLSLFAPDERNSHANPRPSWLKFGPNRMDLALVKWSNSLNSAYKIAWNRGMSYGSSNVV